VTRARGRIAAAGLLAAAVLLVTAAIALRPAASADSGGPLTIEIDIHYSHYDPSSLSVPLGRPVRFVIHNDDPIDHEWIEGNAAVQQIHRVGTELRHAARPTELSIPALSTIETTVTFRTAGSEYYICHLPGHEAYGMVGTLDIK
jgi:uncharacterized cupredoxin-like copper-binding protein